MRWVCALPALRGGGSGGETDVPVVYRVPGTVQRLLDTEKDDASIDGWYLWGRRVRVAL